MHKREWRTRDKGAAIAPIGLIHTPFKHAEGTPIQGIAGERAEGVVEVLPDLIEGLRDLEGFDRLWLIYHFHRASEARLVVLPYLDTTERGVFATRSPVRPNHIGISVVRLLRIEMNRLYVADVDMLDGTPLLDIKPYVPAFDSFEKSRSGWLDGKSASEVVADDRFEAGNADAE
ncbi:MAG: tRNA (N6-threonylcarbamoyladenosine(37)-N6)-methyltransferase TrmO [Terracidiphilus sp.]|jgi:tRNA-Thr(GGU) m(6)t(6)A37 methyltransferase TsaA